MSRVLVPTFSRLSSKLLLTSTKIQLRPPIHLVQRSPLSTTPLRFQRMATNNADFEISKLFDVKGKVALVTGGGTIPHHFEDPR